MKRLSFFAALLLLILTFSSCRVHTGFTSTQNQQQTQVVLSNSNYRIVKYVEGAETAGYFLIFGGGASKRGLEARARENMLKEAGLLGSSRAVINEKVEFQADQFLFYSAVRCIVSAYVVEFFDPEKENPPTAEESIFVEREKPQIVSERYLDAGLSIQSPLPHGWEISQVIPGPHLSTGANWSLNSSPYFYWGGQIDLSFTSFKYDNDYYNRERVQNFMISSPLYIGLRLPFNDKSNWFFEAGPRIGFNFQFTNEKAYRKYMDFLPVLGPDIHTGVRLNDKYQLGVGYFLDTVDEESDFIRAVFRLYL